ncbi:MAG: hypothetical protein OXB88_08160 [Bacteriovoracales bacterium]|nr:hypothetical protein [Bacteriovoracales bacterium]
MMKRNLRHFLDVFWIVILALELTAIPSHALGARGGVAQTLMGAFNGISKEIEQRQQDVERAQFLESLNMAHPKHRKPDSLGLGCFMLPQAPSNLPPFCQQRPEMAGFLGQIFLGNAKLYKEQGRGGQDRRSTVGPKCLDEKKEGLEARFSEHEQKLESFLAAFKEAMGPRITGIEDQLNKIKDINAFLDGGEAASGDQKSMDYASLFQDASCRQTIDSNRAGEFGKRGGLRGIEERLQEKETKAQEIAGLNFSRIVEEDISNIESKFNRFGMAGVDTYEKAKRGGSGNISFGSVGNAYERFYSKFEKEMQNAHGDLELYLKGSGTSLPSFPPDRDFVRKLDQMRAFGATDRSGSWKNQFLNACMSENAGAFLSRFRRRGFSKGKQGPVVKSYKAFFKKLAESKASLTAKRKALARFHQKRSVGSRYPVSIISRGGAEVGVLDFFDEESGLCRRRYDSERIHPGDGSGNPITLAQAHGKALESLDRAKSLYTNFVGTMKETIKGRALRCEGITYNPVPSGNHGCSEQGALNQSGPIFCELHAKNCANSIISCFSRLKGEIKNREGQREMSAAQINREINALRYEMNTKLKDFVGQAKAFNLNLKGSYPSLGPLVLEESTLLLKESLPKLARDFNVALLEGGDMDALWKSFGGSIDKIKNALAHQRESLVGKVDREIANIRQGVAASQQKWEELAKGCSKTAEAFAKANRERMEKQREAMGAVEEICSSMSQGYAQNCEQDSINTLDESFLTLRQTMALSPQDIQSYSDFKRRCLGMRSLQDSGSGDDEDDDGVENEIHDLCQKLDTEENRDAALGNGLDFDRIKDIAEIEKEEVEHYIKDPKSNESILRKLARWAGPFMNTQSKILIALKKREDIISECQKYNEKLSSGSGVESCRTREISDDITTDIDRDPELCRRENAIELMNKKWIKRLISAQNKAIDHTEINNIYGEQPSLDLCQEIDDRSRGERDPYGKDDDGGLDYNTIGVGGRTLN